MHVRELSRWHHPAADPAVSPAPTTPARRGLGGTAGGSTRRRAISRTATRWLLRQMRRRRRLLAAVLAGAAVACGLSAVSPNDRPSRPVLVAAHDLVPGQALTIGDVALRQFPLDLAPVGFFDTVDALVGRRVSGAVRAGEPMTDAQLAGRSMLRGLSGLVAVPVRIADAGVARLLQPGDRVDLVAASADVIGLPIDSSRLSGASSAETQGGRPSLSGRLLAAQALVLTVPGPSPDQPLGGATSPPGALVVVAVPESAGIRLASATTTVQLMFPATT